MTKCSRRLVAGLTIGLVALNSVGAAPSAGTIVPKEKISLFNGEDLSAFDVWLPETGKADPDKVFTVVHNVDGAPAIRSSGQHFGGLVTKKSYANYKLITEFRWGPATWRPRAFSARDSGILLHCQGEPGNGHKTFDSPWMRSVEYQIIEGGTGDIILVGGYDRGNPEFIPVLLTVDVGPDGKTWSPNGKPKVFNQGRMDWQYRASNWKDVLDIRGPKDVEKPVGEWNLIEAICKDGDVTYFLNGVKVNEGRDGSLSEGRLFFQSEGAEIFFRRIELHPLD